MYSARICLSALLHYSRDRSSLTLVHELSDKGGAALADCTPRVSPRRYLFEETPNSSNSKILNENDSKSDCNYCILKITKFKTYYKLKSEPTKKSLLLKKNQFKQRCLNFMIWCLGFTSVVESVPIFSKK